MGSCQSSILPVCNSTPMQSLAPSLASSRSTRLLLEPADTIPAGYPRLAERMGLFPEEAILRRFGALNAENLLYLQAELVHLERELKEKQKMDSECEQGHRSKYSRSWFALNHPQPNEDGEQWKLVQLIRKNLKEYNAAIIQQDIILRMRPPSAFDLDHVQKYLETAEMGPCALYGPDADTWGSVYRPHEHADDLIALLARHNEDAFSRWVTRMAMKIFFRLGWPCSKSLRKGQCVQSLSDEDLLRWSRGITCVVVCAISIGSIVLLQFVHGFVAKLIISAVFTALHSTCLAFFTKARPVDLFAVSAAFSAVQVAFVQAGLSTCEK